MVDAYLFPIKTAILTFMGLSLLIVTPFTIFQYYKYGSVSKARVLILFSFLLYMMTAYYLVILPLPDPQTLSPIDSIFEYTNFVPFDFVIDFIKKSGLHISDIGTYLPALNTHVFFQPLFNGIMTIPFGIYLGYYFKQDLKKTILLTFLLSLFFELTQLSGLYGVYSRPYRLFDVDDLMLNTLGGFIGFAIYQNLLGFLPSRETIDKKSIAKSEKVGYARRFMAFTIDHTLVSTIYLVGLNAFNVNQGLLTTVVLNVILFGYFIGTSILFKQTLGQVIVRIKTVTETPEQNYNTSVFLRYALLLTGFTIYNILDYFVINTYENGIFAIFQLLILVLFAINIVIKYFKDKRLYYELISKTYHVSILNKEILSNKEPIKETGKD